MFELSNNVFLVDILAALSMTIHDNRVPSTMPVTIFARYLLSSPNSYGPRAPTDLNAALCVTILSCGSIWFSKKAC